MDRRTGLLKARSCDLPCYTVCAGGMGDSRASPAFLMFSNVDPSGLTEAEVFRMCEVLDDREITREKKSPEYSGLQGHADG